MLRSRILILLFVISFVNFYKADSCWVVLSKWEKENVYSPQKKKAEVLRILQTNQFDLVCQASFLNRLGMLLQRIGEPDSAIVVYTSAAKLFTQAKNQIGLASCYNQIAGVYSDLEDFPLCLNYYKLAFSIFSEEKFLLGRAVAALNVAEMYYQMDSNVVAEKYCRMSIDDRIEAGDSIKLGGNYVLLAYIYFEADQATKALQYAEIGAEIESRNTDLHGKIQGFNRLGQLFLYLEQKERSLYFFRESLRLAKEIKFERMMAEGSRSLAEYYATYKQFDSAYAFYQIYSEYKDQMASENLNNVIAAKTVEYETEKNLLELQKQQEQKRNSQRLNIFLAIVLLLTVVLLVFLVRSFSQRRKIQEKEAELSSANAMIKGQDGERERIARELHDRVGSMISAIKLHFGVLEHRLQRKTAKDEQAIEMVMNLVDETYDEVRRISHDLDTGLLGNIGLHNAMQKLAHGIASTRKLDVRYIDTGMKDEITKQFETEIYRITQELISNTIKYAQAQEVSIQLSLSEGKVVYSYEDDGKGFDKEILAKTQSIGYKNLDTRVKRIKGKWFLETSPGNGTNVIIEIPIL